MMQHQVPGRPSPALIRRLSRPGDVTGWLDLAPGICLGRRGDGRVRQAGVIRAAMIVIDDPLSPAEDNPGGKGNDRPDGTPMRCAQDYLDHFAGDASAFLQASSYGLCDITVTLVRADTPTGVFRLSGTRRHTYPDVRGGDVNAYVYEALDMAADALRRAGDRFDVLYVVAAENFEAISYGPTDVRGDKLWALGLYGYGALVRIGQDSYKKFGKKAFIHELGHDLGLPDLYVNDENSQRDAFSGKIDAFPAVGHWGMMSWINSPSHDFLGWEKWQLGWIDDSQVAVVDGDGTESFALTATSVAGGLKLAAVPGPRPGVLYLLEYKRAAGVETGRHKEPGKPAFASEGLYICRIDSMNRTMESPVTTVNLFPVQTPQQQTEPAIDTLARSVLGPCSGRFAFEDAAAGLHVSLAPGALPENPAAPLVVTVCRRTPPERERAPVLAHAAFLDLDTLEVQTSFDLRGINKKHVTVLRHGRPIGPVTLDHVGTGTLRVRLDPGTLQDAADMDGVCVQTEAFSFYAASRPADVRPAAPAAAPVISAARRDAGTVAVRADVDLSAARPRHFRLLRAGGAPLPPHAFSASFEDGGRTALLSAHAPADMAHVLAVQVAMASNYHPDTATAAQMYFGAAANGITLRPASNTAALDGQDE